MAIRPIDHSQSFQVNASFVPRNSIIHRFHMEDAKPLSIPMDPNNRLSKENCPVSIEEKQEMKTVPYREVIGALNWVHDPI